MSFPSSSTSCGAIWRSSVPGPAKFVACHDNRERRILAARPGLASMTQLVYPHEAESLTRVPPAAREDAYGRFLHKKVAVDLEYERRRTLLTVLGLMVEVALLVVGVKTRVDLSTDREMGGGSDHPFPAP